MNSRLLHAGTKLADWRSVILPVPRVVVPVGDTSCRRVSVAL